MYVVAAQITAQVLVLVLVAELAAGDVKVVQEDVRRPAHLVAPVGVPVLVQEVVLAAAQVDVPEVVLVHVRMHVRVVQEDVWVIAREHVQALVQELVPLHVQDGTIINIGY